MAPEPEADWRSLPARLDVEVSPGLLERALVHRSFAYENGGLPTNERLEFLGDAVLGLVVTDSLYTRHPDLPEGQLAKLRASVVNQKALADVARGLDLGRHIFLGRGERATGGSDKDSILSDTLEALIGAVYESTGIGSATVFVHQLLDELLAERADEPLLDPKTALQELTARHALGVPIYVITESGPDHAKWFTATCLVDDTPRGQGEGRSKKVAEQAAAAAAYRGLIREYEGGPPAASGTPG